MLDVLLVQGAGDGVPGRLTAYKQSLSEDHTFLKVLGKKKLSVVLLVTYTVCDVIPLFQH